MASIRQRTEDFNGFTVRRTLYPAGPDFSDDDDYINMVSDWSRSYDKKVERRRVKKASQQKFLTPTRAVVLWLLLVGVCLALLVYGPNQGFQAAKKSRLQAALSGEPNATVHELVPESQFSLEEQERILLLRWEQQELSRLEAALDMSPMLHALLHDTRARMAKAQRQMEDAAGVYAMVAQLSQNLTATVQKLQERIRQLDADTKSALAAAVRPAGAVQLWQTRQDVQSRLMAALQALTRLQDQTDALFALGGNTSMEQASALQEAARKHQWASGIARRASAWMAQQAEQQEALANSASQVGNQTWQEAVLQHHQALTRADVAALAGRAGDQLQRAWERLEVTRSESADILNATLQLAFNWSESLAAERLCSTQDRLLKCQHYLALQLEVPAISELIAAKLQEREGATEGAQMAVAEAERSLEEQETKIRRQLQAHASARQAWDRAEELVAELAQLREDVLANATDRHQVMERLLRLGTMVQELEDREASSFVLEAAEEREAGHEAELGMEGEQQEGAMDGGPTAGHVSALCHEALFFACQ